MKIPGVVATSFDPRAGEKSKLTLTLRRSATVSAAIYAGDTKIRTIWSGTSLATGTVTWSWTGKTSSGATAKPGTYRIRLTATSTYGTTVVTRSVKVEVH